MVQTPLRDLTMTFNIIDLLTQEGIEFRRYGRNVKRGNINVKCPWCADDPSEHLGIKIDMSGNYDGAYGCWRNRSQHSGRKPHYLLMMLLRCSFNYATKIIDAYEISDPDHFETMATSFLKESTKPSTGKTKHSLTFPNSFHKIRKRGTGHRFWRYLKQRGFKDPQKFSETYNLRCCSVGSWKDRIIIPVYERRKLVTWTGRAITKTIDAPRYKTLSKTIGDPMKAKINTNETLLLHDDLVKGGEALLITEGPFDALKLDYYGRSYGACATCLFGLNISVSQMGLIASVRHRFKSAWLILDAGAMEAKLRIGDELSRYGVRTVELPLGFDDPGELNSRAAHTFVKSLIKI